MKNVHNPTILRIVVVGGGISGLAAAHRILEGADRLNQPVDLKLLEAGSRLGGVIHTSERDGFLLEGGPDSFISEKPWALSLCHRLGLEPSLIGTSDTDRRSFIVREGKLQPVPDGFYLLAPTRIWPTITTPIFSWAGKIRMSADLVLPRKKRTSATEDESLADFVRRRLGQEALDRMAQPMIGGIYTSDPEELSLRATMPRFLDMEQEHRSLILAMWRQRQKTQQSQNHQAAGPRYGLFVSLDQGMVRLVEALQKRLPPDSIHLNTQVSALRKSPSGPLMDSGSQERNSTRSRRRLSGSGSLSVRGLGARIRPRSLQPSCAAFATRRQQRSISHIPWKTFPATLEGFGFVVPAIEKRRDPGLHVFPHEVLRACAPQPCALASLYGRSATARSL